MTNLIIQKNLNNSQLDNVAETRTKTIRIFAALT